MSERDELIECLRVCGACHGCGIGADGDTCTNCGDERQLNRLAASLLERDGDEIERLGRELAEAREERYPPIPPSGSAARSLGAYLADVLCEDQWARAEEMLLGIHAAYVALRAENDALRKALALVYGKWVKGDECYQDPETYTGFLGLAFKLDMEEEDAVIAALSAAKERTP